MEMDFRQAWQIAASRFRELGLSSDDTARNSGIVSLKTKTLDRALSVQVKHSGSRLEFSMFPMLGDDDVAYKTCRPTEAAIRDELANR